MNANTRILVVDDDPIIRETLSLNLEDQDFQVQGLPSGEALLDHLRQGGSADLILLDWKMGQFSGLDTLREMRRSEEHTSELQSLMRISYAVFCLKKNTQNTIYTKN